MIRLITLLLIWMPFGLHAEETATNAHHFTFSILGEGDVPLSRYKGQPVLVVNTASECGFTPQYRDLETLHQTFKDRGLVVLAVPSNDFGGQEPGSNEQIQSFTDEQFDITFPLAAKTSVKGDNAHPFYEWSNDQAGIIGSPKWNFHKYLIGPDGEFIDWYASTTSPMDDKIIQAIEKTLR